MDLQSSVYASPGNGLLGCFQFLTIKTWSLNTALNHAAHTPFEEECLGFSALLLENGIIPSASVSSSADWRS
jgi:hypothetical protein